MTIVYSICIFTISVSEIFQISKRTSNLLVTIPLISTKLAKHNFVFQASLLWNTLIGKLMNACWPNSNGIIPSSATCSDLSAPISVIKNKTERCYSACTKIGFSSSTSTG